MYFFGLSLEKALAVIAANIIRSLVHLLQTAEFDIKKEAAWAISKATSGGNNEQTKYLVSQGCIRPLCDLLVCPDPIIVTICLEGLENILKVGEAEKNVGHTKGMNVFAQLIDSSRTSKAGKDSVMSAFLADHLSIAFAADFVPSPDHFAALEFQIQISVASYPLQMESDVASVNSLLLPLYFEHKHFLLG
ncbi:hypothetical protein IFM89_003180 [Coptis chinensis]|uniref:Uncharacterized protein n=1 Tax=Coptis chinensis TaxID=261450 RepID=A0A835H2V4_9MAGN|nr:hypothetical protein IFM89_003180 [Coptis chinensis]